MYGLSTDEPFAVLEIGDFDGNGAPDILVATPSGTKICISPLARLERLSVGVSKFVFNCDGSLAAKGENVIGAMPYVVDVTGDGRPSHYTPINANGKAYLCTGSSCVEDSDPPKRVLNSTFSDPNSASFTQRDYVAFTQMVDYAGVGKPYDTRWTAPMYVERDQNGNPIQQPYWANLAPRVAITGFRKPGERLAQVADYVYPEISCTVQGAWCPSYYQFDWPYRGGGLSADFNGSGYNSLIFGYIETKDWFKYNRIETTVCLSTGRSLDCDVRRKFSGARTETPGDTGYSVIHSVGNFVGDGMPGILVEKQSMVDGIATRSGQLQMCRLTGDSTAADKSDASMVCTDWAGPGLPLGKYIDPEVTAEDKFYFMDLLGTGRSQLVKYRSGKYVNNVWVEDGRWEVYAPVDIAPAGQALDRIHRVTNGLGAVDSVVYEEQGYDNRSTNDRPYPQPQSPFSGKLVKRSTHGNGASVSRSYTYQYSAPAINLQGRGVLGFGRVKTTDVENGIQTDSLYSQIWPHIGQVETKWVSSRVNNALAEEKNTLKSQTITYANGARTVFPYVGESAITRRDWYGQELGTVTTTNTYEETPAASYGNLKLQKIVSSGGGNEFVTTIATTYQDNATKWLIGLPDSVTRTQSSTVAGVKTSEARKVAYAFDPNGLLSKVTTEPDAAGDEGDRYRVVTDYIRTGNTFGLVKQTKQTWKHSNQTLTRVLSDIDYESKGRFPLTVKNALGQQKTIGFDGGTGAIISLKGPNGLSISAVPDGFGRIKTTINDQNGSRVQSYFKRCLGDCPGGAKVVQITDAFNGANRTDAPLLAYADAQGRVLTAETWGFDGTRIRADKEYDSQGRLERTYQPTYLNQQRYLDKRFAYDGLGRVEFVYGQDETGTETVNKTQYVGYKTIQTNPMTYSRTVERDVVGQIRSVKDANGKSTTYTYSPFGDLASVTDPLGNVTTISYDRLGRKTDLNDPDLGWIHYDVDALGRVWQEVSPNQRGKGRSTRTEYDMLDRVTGRYSFDLESHWIYDTAPNGIGQLAEAYVGANKDGYRRTYEYDELARPKQVTQWLTDGTYVQKTEYDDWSRPKAQVYQRNADTAKRFDMLYNGWGYIERVMRGDLELWKVNKQDAANRLREAKLGNGLIETKAFNDYTGTLTSIQTSAGGVRRTEVSYEYDKLSNVKKRVQYWENAGFIEDFSYDNLNRVKSSKVLSQEQSYTYNDDGSIASKSGLGTYSYPPGGNGVKQPHAVTNITGLGAFNYDDNGNVLVGAGRTTEWTDFDMPAKISDAAGHWSKFAYGPERQRTRQDRGESGDVIYAGPQEVVASANGNTVKTYWPAGIGLEIDRPNAATELLWSHVDHLGSTVALTDIRGAVKERMSYDVWGKWRRLNEAGMPISLNGMPDTSGYTGHEMLDQLDLVHMNGRVYDPNTARFLSADPHVTDPFNGQSLNRYSYVINNPLAYTDPTGFDPVYGQVWQVAYNNPWQPTSGSGSTNCSTWCFQFNYSAIRNDPKPSPLPGPATPAAPDPSKAGKAPKDVTSMTVQSPTYAGSGGIASRFEQSAFGQFISTMGQEFKAGWRDTKNSNETLGEFIFDKVLPAWPGGGSSTGLALRLGRFGLAAETAVQACCCFPAGTPIATEAGMIPIEEIKVGQLVYARNPDSGETKLKPVTQLMITQPKPLFKLTTRDVSGKLEAMEVTDNHPYWVEGQGWVDAENLQPGMVLANLDAGSLLVVSLEMVGRSETTYNFTVADFHTFFAGKQKAFVHNCNNTCKFGAQAVSSLARLPAPAVMHDHHLLPQQFKSFFAKLKINIHQHTVTISELSHQTGLHRKGLGNMPGGWNAQWADWIAKNPNATAAQVYQKLGQMMVDYNIAHLPIHPYKQ